MILPRSHYNLLKIRSGCFPHPEANQDMNHSDPESNNSNSHTTTGAQIDEVVQSFIDSTENLARTLDADDSVIDEFLTSANSLAQLVGDAAHKASDADKRTENLQQEIDQERERRSAEVEGVHNRINRVSDEIEAGEADSHDKSARVKGGRTTVQEPETSLEEIARLPEHVADESLSRNQQRARFVSKSIKSYSRSVPAGRSISSSELRRVLTASEDNGGKIHTETVSRVINYLTELGGDDVNLRETRGGERVVVFTDEIVERIEAFHKADHDVVAQGKVSG